MRGRINDRAATRQIADEALYRSGLTGGGGDGPFNTHIVWVSTSGGSDVTGDGTVNKPFATISKGMTSITDATFNVPYTILVSPGNYTEDLVLKAYVSITGLDQLGVRISSASMTYDPAYDPSGNGYNSFENLVLLTDPNLVGDPTIHGPQFVSVITEVGMTIQGAQFLSIYDSVIAGGSASASVTDVVSVFTRTSSFEGGAQVLFASATLAAPSVWDSDTDRFIFGVKVTSSSGQPILFAADGALAGPVNIDTTFAAFEGTLNAAGTSLVLTGGALASQYRLDGGGDATNGQVPVADGAGLVAWGLPYQKGSVTLGVGTGVFVLTGAFTVTPTSVVLVTRKTQGGTVLLTSQYEAPSAGRVVGGPGFGSITFQASLPGGGINTADASELDYAIL